MSTKAKKYNVRKHGSYHTLVEFRTPISEIKDLLQRRQARVERCTEALKVARKDKDLSRFRDIRKHLEWARERLDLAMARRAAKKAAKAAA